jgi:hypothetical protein
VDLINFIKDLAGDPDMGKRFLKRKTALGIYRFFQEEGYKDIPLNDCEDILKTKKRLEELRVPPISLDHYVMDWCDPRPPGPKGRSGSKALRDPRPLGY